MNKGMKKKQLMKIAVDFLMTVALLLLMTYEFIGQATHEWIGCGMFLLFLLHHILNRRWLMSIAKGKYTSYRIIQTLISVLIFGSMLGSMLSGIFLSQTLFVSFRLYGEWANSIHMLSAYWGFVWMGLHLGLHWSIMIGMAKKLVPESGKAVRYILRAVTLCTLGYGIYAFIHRNFPMYMTLRYHFLLFDYDEPFLYVLLDHVAIMITFVCIGHYLGRILRYRKKR